MDFLKHFDWSAKSIAKIVGITILGIAAIAIVISLLKFSINTIFNNNAGYRMEPQYAYDAVYDYDDYGMEGSMVRAESMGITASSAKMPTITPLPEPGYSVGNNAEAFEVKEYYGTIKTRKLDQTCAVIADLKIREDVIFENSDKNKDYCNYRFKVTNETADEIVKIIEDLNPENFNASIYSIKKSIEGYDDELDILTKKLTSIEETLEEAQNSYDEISKIATKQNDAETLAKIIDSKLRLIEQLSNQRLSVKEQIDRYNKIKETQMDRLNFTFFNVNVYKDLIIDWKEIKDSWKYESKQLVRNINEVFQGISVHLATYLVRFAQVVIYLFISIFILKFVWLGVKRVWKGKRR
ncbi:hypothetical protein JW758_00035 [Candidatus Peregrinibacteria bacterium]|nr:hypothetical protein [Candidatus Peregrinibacteria bacterium]